MYKDILENINLSSAEAIVYEYLLKNGQSPAGDIIKKTPLKRGLVYKVLRQLIEKGLILEKKSIPSKKQGKNKISHFLPNHPENLREFIKGEKKKMDKAENTLETIMPAIISDFNLVSGKPGVRFFEGIEGVKKVIGDTLINNFKREISTFSDVAAYMKYLKDWNMNFYAPKRREFKIHERVMIPDDPAAVEYMKEYIKNPLSDELTDILFIDHKLYPLGTEINIYENKVSFVTFSEKMHIGLIIENKEIFKSISSVFNLIWTTLKK